MRLMTFAGWGCASRGHLLAGYLVLDEAHELLLVGVLEAGGVERLGHALHQAARHVQLRVVHGGAIGRLREVAHLALVVQRHHDQVVAVGDERQRRLGVAQHRGADGGLALLDHGQAQKLERLLAAGLGPYLVGLLEVDGRHLLQVHELHDLHGTVGIGLDSVQLLVAHHHVLALLVLVAAHDVVRAQLAVAVGARLHVAHTLHALLRQLVEAHGIVLGGGVELHRYVDEAEGDRAFPSCHGASCRSGIGPIAAGPAS